MVGYENNGFVDSIREMIWHEITSSVELVTMFVWLSKVHRRMIKN